LNRELEIEAHLRLRTGDDEVKPKERGGGAADEEDDYWTDDTLVDVDFWSTMDVDLRWGRMS